MNQLIQHCQDLILRPDIRRDYLLELRKKCSGVSGYFSNYIPQEILAAAGFHPLRIIGRYDTSGCHGRSLYTPVCSFARDVFAAAESGAFADLACVIFPNSCDSLRVLQQMWPSLPPAYGLAHPVVADDNAIDCFTAQLREFAKKLQKHTGRDFTDTQLADEIQRYNQTRRLLREVYALAKTNPAFLKGSGRITLVTAAMIMDRDEYNLALDQILTEGRSAAPAALGPARRIMLIGPLVDNLDLLAAIEQRGGSIIDDDITNGRRYFDLNVECEGDLYRNLAKRYLRSGPSPTVSTEIHADEEIFRRRMTDLKPDGVICINQQFCEPHVHSYLGKLDILREMNIGALMLEVDHGSPAAAERDLLRIESFLEVL